MALESPYIAKQVVGADFIQFQAAIQFKTNYADILKLFFKGGVDTLRGGCPYGFYKR